MIDPAAIGRLQQAVQDITGASMVTRFVVVAETVGDDGELLLSDITSPGLPYWDFTGMLTAAAQGREAQPMRAYSDEDE